MAPVTFFVEGTKATGSSSSAVSQPVSFTSPTDNVNARFVNGNLSKHVWWRKYDVFRCDLKGKEALDDVPSQLNELAGWPWYLIRRSVPPQSSSSSAPQLAAPRPTAKVQAPPARLTAAAAKPSEAPRAGTKRPQEAVEPVRPAIQPKAPAAGVSNAAGRAAIDAWAKRVVTAAAPAPAAKPGPAAKKPRLSTSSAAPSGAGAASSSSGPRTSQVAAAVANGAGARAAAGPARASSLPGHGTVVVSAGASSKAGAAGKQGKAGSSRATISASSRPAARSSRYEDDDDDHDEDDDDEDDEDEEPPHRATCSCYVCCDRRAANGEDFDYYACDKCHRRERYCGHDDEPHEEYCDCLNCHDDDVDMYEEHKRDMEQLLLHNMIVGHGGAVNVLLYEMVTGRKVLYT